MEYVHIATEDLEYELTEKVLEHEGKRVLYLLSELRAPIFLGCDGTCVQPSEAKTVFVKGGIVKWQYRTNDAGRPVSELEPVGEGEDSIKKMLQEEHGTANIFFD